MRCLAEKMKKDKQLTRRDRVCTLCAGHTYYATEMTVFEEMSMVYPGHPFIP